MNARVLLLVLVTGLFMAAWDSDQTAMQAALARRAQQREAAMARVDSPVNATQAKVSRPHRLTSASVVTHSPASLRASERVPLPVGIAIGSYQAVSQAGDTIRIEIDRESGATTPKRDFYLVDGKDGSRWYLIRIE